MAYKLEHRDLYPGIGMLECMVCGLVQVGSYFHADHAFPTTDERCTNNLSNFLVLCSVCNGQKKALSLRDFISNTIPGERGMRLLEQIATYTLTIGELEDIPGTDEHRVTRLLRGEVVMQDRQVDKNTVSKTLISGSRTILEHRSGLRLVR